MSRKVTGENLVSYISQLDKNVDYNYIHPTTKALIRIVRIEKPSGPIFIKRWNPHKGETAEAAKIESISKEMIWRIANAFIEGQPINVDRILGASYNTRSILESLIVHTPQFYYCYPGRIIEIGGKPKIKKGHKHVVWLPSEPHANGQAYKKSMDVAISETPIPSAVYEALIVPNAIATSGMSIEAARRHTQIQIALYLIGLQLGYRTWIAQNDKGIHYKGRPLIEHEGIVKSLQNENMIEPYDGAVQAGLFIDCIWFKNNQLLMPAIMEVEHSTGVTSGLNRILNFTKKIPQTPTRHVIVAPDEDRAHVVQEANKPAFYDLDVRFFPYSAVEELYALCQHRKLKGVTEEFLDCYMERIRAE